MRGTTGPGSARSPDQGSPRFLPHLAAAVVTVGALLRLAHFLSERALSVDEARLALNIGTRTYARLLPPLDHDQSAPLLFLWAQRLAVELFGVHELALRAVPLLAGVLVPVAAFAAARRLLAGPGVLLLTGALSFAPILVLYSADTKQYGVEALVTLVLLKAALDRFVGPSSGSDRAWLFGLAVLAPWLSASASFLLAGIALAVGFAAIVRRTWNPVGFLAALGGIVSAIAAYLLVYRAAATNPYMRRFWGEAFLSPWEPEFGARAWAAVGEMVWGFVVGTVSRPAGILENLWLAATAGTALLCMALGSWWLVRRLGGTVLALILGPLVAVTAASALQLYPIALRVMVWSVPLLLILVVAGLEAGLSRLGPSRGRAAWVAIGVLVLVPLLVVSLVQTTLLGRSRYASRLIHEVQQRRTPGEGVYVFARAIPLWAYYTTDWSSPDTIRLAELDRLSRPGGPAFENAPSRRTNAVQGPADLPRDSRLGNVVLGLPSGMEYRALIGVAMTAPDSGWANQEALRIRSSGSSAAWILLSHFYPQELTHLLEALEQQGAVCREVAEGNGNVLARYEFRLHPSGGSDPRGSTRSCGVG